MNHEHDWQPLIGWVGRYRCEGCGAFGYRRALTPYGKPGEIAPYLCSFKSCQAPAVGKYGKADKWRCAAHKEDKA